MMGDDDRDRLLLHALADGELDAATAIRLEQRIEQDVPLAAEYDRICAAKDLVHRLERPRVSDDFSARIAALARTAPALASRNGGAWRPSADWRALAASFVMTAALASGLTYSLVAPGAPQSTEDAIIGGHRRSLLASNPIDIATSDRHTVRPWFDAKLGVSPPTPDLASVGFPLVGGRVDIIDDRAVPSLVYRHKEHLITVEALPVKPGDDGTQAAVSSKAGPYNVMRWGQTGFRYWAVSDLDATNLRTFVDALRAQGD